ncbi:MAG: hypothetical protein ACFCVE_12555 [Phycisphaerae bacterium]
MSIAKRLFAATFTVVLAASMLTLAGCQSKVPQYGREARLALPAGMQRVWAIAPAQNISGEAGVDPLLQADILYSHVEQISGVTAVPVNRAAEVMAALGLRRIESLEQAQIICELLGVDGIIVPTVTLFDPYDPPRFGVSLQVFESTRATTLGTGNLDPRELARMAAPTDIEPLSLPADFRQKSGVFDATNGSTRDAVAAYAAGRNDPTGPVGVRAYFLDMERFCGFAYHELLSGLVREMSADRLSQR